MVGHRSPARRPGLTIRPNGENQRRNRRGVVAYEQKAEKGLFADVAVRFETKVN